MRRLTRGLVLGAAVLAAAGCQAAVMAGADFDRSVPFGHPASFAWDEPDPLPTGDARLDANPFFRARLHAAVERAFAARGIRLDASRPSLLVHHHATVRERVEYVYDRAASADRNAPGMQIYPYDEGTFLIDLVDARTHQVVWRGWAVADLTGALGDARELARLVDLSVQTMFEDFPIAAGTPAVVEPPAAEPAPAEPPPWLPSPACPPADPVPTVAARR